VAIYHRVGRLELGELPVIIGVSSPHRKIAFTACQYAIDTLKETVPIWKREFFEDGDVWVSATP
jgi:molybdopterin synthase catalytic subunit